MIVKITVTNRVATVEPIPSSACLVIKALKEPPRDRKKEKNSTTHTSQTLLSLTPPHLLF